MRGNGGIIGVLNTSKSGVWGLHDVAVNRNEISPQWAYGTGGTVTTADGYRIHTFTSTGTFTCTKAGEVEYLVVAGGGGGGGAYGAGGGAGGVRSGKVGILTGEFDVVVGGGGSGGTQGGTLPTNGTNSSFDAITSTGGGCGGGNHASVTSPASGGSGGGARGSTTGASGNAGDTPRLREMLEAEIQRVELLVVAAGVLVGLAETVPPAMFQVPVELVWLFLVLAVVGVGVGVLLPPQVPLHTGAVVILMV